MPLAAGTQLGPYEIVAPLGAGGMGEVYRARDPRLSRDVAIKVLPRELSTDPQASARFKLEARAIAAISHPNILTIHGIGSEGDVVYEVLELVEGATLRQRLEDGTLAIPRAAAIAAGIARGLAAAHDMGYRMTARAERAPSARLRRTT
jgi:eukaryotic-like serine/threonine-protein kinase